MNLPANLIDAIKDYSFLLEKGYPDKRSLTLISDRYHLDRHQRGLLFRGVFRRDEANRRRQKRVFRPDHKNSELHIDLLNQVYSVNSYFEGRLVFLAMDGVLRDAAEMHGSTISLPCLDRTLEVLLGFVSSLPDRSVSFYLDEKPDISADVKVRMEARLASSGRNDSIILTGTVDQILADKRTGLLATSDSTIIDRTDRGIFDLAWWVLHVNFDPKLPDLRSFLP